MRARHPRRGLVEDRLDPDRRVDRLDLGQDRAAILFGQAPDVDPHPAGVGHAVERVAAVDAAEIE